MTSLHLIRDEPGNLRELCLTSPVSMGTYAWTTRKIFVVTSWRQTLKVKSQLWKYVRCDEPTQKKSGRKILNTRQNSRGRYLTVSGFIPDLRNTRRSVLFSEMKLRITWSTCHMNMFQMSLCTFLTCSYMAHLVENQLNRVLIDHLVTRIEYLHHH